MGTTTVIYADTLFFVNFSMDFLALYLTARMTRRRVRPVRMATAAAVGAAFAVLAAALGSGWQEGAAIAAASAAVAAIVAAAMTALAFGQAGGCTLIFAGVSMGLGGIMTAAIGMLERITGGSMHVTPDASPVLFAVVAAVSGGFTLLWGRVRRRSRRHDVITVTAFGQTWTLTVLVDSGNLLREPISGRSVIIAAASRLPVTEEMWQTRARLIPAGSIGGRRILRGFLPDRVMCGGRELDAVVALDPRADSYDGCDGILPEILIS